MDIGTVIFIVVIALAAGWFWGNRNQQDSQKALERSNADLENMRRALGVAGEKAGRLENQLKITSGDYEQRLTAVYGQLDQAALGIDKVLSMFPYIEDVNNLMERMSREDFMKLDLPFGAEFQAGMTQLAAQQTEAIVKLSEAGRRLALGMHFLKMTGATIAPNTTFVAELLVQQNDLMVKYAPLLKTPGFKQQLAEFFAINMARINTAYRNGEERPDQKLVDLCLKAIDEANAKIQAEADKAKAYPDFDQSWPVPASDEVLFTAPPADSRDFDFHYEIPPRPSTNGNGTHKKG